MNAALIIKVGAGCPTHPIEPQNKTQFEQSPIMPTPIFLRAGVGRIGVGEALNINGVGILRRDAIMR